jgi:hypothetical protein
MTEFSDDELREVAQILGQVAAEGSAAASRLLAVIIRARTAGRVEIARQHARGGQETGQGDAQNVVGMSDAQKGQRDGE